MSPRLSEAQVKVVESQNTALKDMTYEKDLSTLTSQKDLFEQERREWTRDVTQTKENMDELYRRLLSIVIDVADNTLQSVFERHELIER